MKIKKTILISLLFAFLFIPFVSASSVEHTSVGYGYNYYDTNNTLHTVNWVSYNTNNLIKYNYDLPATYNDEGINIIDFGFRFHITNNFSAGTSYTINFTWMNSDPALGVFALDYSHLVYTLHCRLTSWNSTGYDESYCFNSTNISYQRGSTDSEVNVTFTFTPKVDFYGTTIYYYHDNDPYTSFSSDGWEIYNISYSETTDNSQAIINNQNQNTQNIINNQNQNTQSIINNQNSNTQDIIDNQNSNTQAIIDSNKSCQFIDKNNISIDSSYLSSSGNILSSTGFGITSYYNLTNSTIEILFPIQFNPNIYLCYYNVNKNLISCVNEYNVTSLDIPSNASYIRFSIAKSSNRPTAKICTTGTQAINDSLTNDDISGANSDASNFFSGFTTETYGLTGVITAPLNVIQSITSKTCSPLVLPLPFVNENLTLPCMGQIYSQYFCDFLTIYQTITFGVVAYWVVVRIFNLVKDFKNPDHDEIEVLDL